MSVLGSGGGTVSSRRMRDTAKARRVAGVKAACRERVVAVLRNSMLNRCLRLEVRCSISYIRRELESFDVEER